MGKALFITGTGTGVGKTFFSYLLCKALKEGGYKVSYWKPVETGAKTVPHDAALLANLLKQTLEETVTYTFKLPLAPYVAEKYEGEKINLKALREIFKEKLEKNDFLVVEGAGGLAVPIKRNYTYANFAKDLNLPILIVSDARLGTINHSFLTDFFAKGIGLKRLGFVLNRFTGKDFAERDNPTVIEEMTGLKVLFKIPETTLEGFNLEKEGLKELMKRLED